MIYDPEERYQQQLKQQQNNPQPQTQATQKKPEKKQSFYEKWNILPTIGAIGGAALGGLVSSPTIAGIPAGIIAGGAAGAGGGEALEQYLTKKPNLKGLAAETIMGGAAPGVGKVVGRIAKPITKPISELAGKVLPPIGRLTGLDPRELYQTAFKFKPSTLQQSQRHGIDILGELMDEKIKPSGNLLEQVNTALKDKATQLKGLLETATKKGVKIGTDSIAKLYNPIKERLSNTAIPGVENTIASLEQQIQAIKGLGKFITPLEAQRQKEALDEFIRFNVQDPNLKQQILQVARSGYKKAIESAVGGTKVKALNTRLAALIQASERLGEMEGVPTSVGLRELFGLPSAAAFGYFLGGPVGAAIGGGAAVAQTIARSSPEAAIGIANAIKGFSMPKIPQVVKTGIGVGVGQAAIRGLVGRLVPSSKQVQPVNQEQTNQNLENQGLPPISGSISQGVNQNQENPYPIENYMADSQRDPKNEEYYRHLYEQYQKLYPAQTTPKLTSQQQTNKISAESGLRALDTLEQQIKNNPNVLLEAALPGSPGARLFTTAKKEASDVLTRLRTGAALNADEQKFYQSQLPQLFDSNDTIAYKIKLFRDLFNRMSNPQQVPIGTTAETLPAIGGQ